LAELEVQKYLPSYPYWSTPRRAHRCLNGTKGKQSLRTRTDF